MKKVIYVVAFVVVVGGFLAGALKVHENKNQQIQAQTSSLQQKLSTAQRVVSSLQSELTTKTTQADQQFKADQQQLCAFITSHVNTKTVPVPSECTANPL